MADRDRAAIRRAQTCLTLLEAAHEITGQVVCCFVTLKKRDWDHEQLGKDLRQ
jgi:hypothetical protein